MQKKSVAKRFLKLLVAAGSLSFTDLKKGLATSNNVLNYWRVRLLARELITRKDRLYKITPIGRMVLRSKRLWNLVFSRKTSLIEDRVLYFSPRLQVYPAFRYLSNMPYRVTVLMSSDMRLERILDKTVYQLELDGSYFLHLLVEEIARQHGLTALETLRPISKISDFDDVMWAKRAYDFNVILMVEFYGRKWVDAMAKSLGWEQLLDQAKQSDKHFKESLETARKLANQAFEENLDSILKKMLTEELRSADIRTKAFQKTMREYYANLLFHPCDDEGKLLKSIVEGVKERISSLAPSVRVPEESIWKKLKELKSEGAFKTKKITLSAIEIL